MFINILFKNPFISSTFYEVDESNAIWILLVWGFCFVLVWFSYFSLVDFFKFNIVFVGPSLFLTLSVNDLWLTFVSIRCLPRSKTKALGFVPALPPDIHLHSVEIMEVSIMRSILCHWTVWCIRKTETHISMEDWIKM